MITCSSDPDTFKLIKEYRGHQMGSYFGSVVCLVDLNNDKIDDLLVGAPLWMGKHADMGQVILYLSSK